MDLLIRGGTLVPCDPEDRAVSGDLWISAGRIVALGPGVRPPPGRAHRVLDARGCAVVPGFVQTHVHLCQTLFRGMADDMPLLEWLKQRIWPFEAAHDPDSLRASAMLGVTELLRGGTTTVLDMGTVHHHDAVFEVLRDTGIRAVSGKAMMDDGVDVPAGLRETTAQSLTESERLCDRWHGAENGRLRYAFSPRFILTSTEALVRATVALARSRGAIMHTHASEHAGERDVVRARYGKDDVEVLADWGLAGRDVVLAHAVQLTAAQRKEVSRLGTRVTHCPSANMKLGSGVAKVRAMRRAGVVVGLGADGAACNNNLDALVEVRHAALLARRLGRTDALPTRSVLRMATLDGARALGLDGEIGSLEVGKRADVTVVDLTGPHCEPGGDVFSRLVYAAQTRDVRHVVVDGVVRVRDGELTGIDPREVTARARAEARRLVARSGVRGVHV